MKKILLSALALLILIAQLKAQPQIITPTTWGGPQNGGAILRLDLPASTPGIIHSFNNLNPHLPSGGVVAGDEDWLYGMVVYNGTNNEGAAYRIRKDGTGFTKLFDLGTGNRPVGTPYYHTDGKIYFNAEFSIKVFDPVTMGVETIITNGFAYSKNLYIDTDDYIYYLGFQQLTKLKIDGSDFLQLHTFNGPTDGTFGDAGVTEVPGGRIFGVVKNGGAEEGGTIFSIQKDGTGFTVHHHFTNATGIYPESKLEYFDGKLYGTTSRGGNNDVGVLYTINADGSDYRVLVHFDITIGPSNDPRGNIQVAPNGRIFGCYSQFRMGPGGGTDRLWKVDSSGENLVNFLNVNQRENGHFNRDILLTNDSIFLVTEEMGRHEGGVLSLADTSAFSAIPLQQFGASANGFYPKGGLIKASDSRLYGTTTIGGPSGNGIVYSINANGSGFTKLHDFTDAEGYELQGSLLEASDGKLYGACFIGGPTNTGCLYRLDKNGANFQVIYNFPDFGQGFGPTGSLVEGAGGVLYGCFQQSLSGPGIFRINLDGSGYTILKFFTAGELGMPGRGTGLRLYRNYLYGVSQTGGASGAGGIFRLRTDGTGYQQLLEFNMSNGGLPQGTPAIGNNGYVYGSTEYGGSNGYGTLYRIDTAGANFQVLRHLNYTVDGAYPRTSLIQASDGLLYGTTGASGIDPGGAGTLFRMNLDGSGFTTLKEFNSQTEGQAPNAVMDLNGNFPLPVSWLDFTALQKEHAVLLEWQTAQEENADQFIIERSVNGISFQRIGAVPATGNTTLVSRYAFTDQNPATGDNYYRLKQTDRNGQFSYSKTVRINFTHTELITLSPNPAHENLMLRLPVSQQVKSIGIYDASGRLVKRYGPFNASSIILPVYQLNSGMYTLQVETMQKNYRLKFMKQ